MIPGEHGSIGARHHVLAIAGSLRQRSYNRMLLQAARVLSPPELELELYAELASIPLFDEDLESQTGGGPPPVRRLRAKVKEAHGLLISTPEYNQSTSGVLKNAIDWLSRPGVDEVLIKKPVAIVGASGGRWGTRLAQANLRQVLTATESLVMPQPAIFVAESAKAFDNDGALINDLLRQQLENFLCAFVAWLGLINKQSLPKAK
jgi:chromate reductase, NAD(P)H dehydrogenase (quinone)